MKSFTEYLNEKGGFSSEADKQAALVALKKTFQEEKERVEKLMEFSIEDLLIQAANTDFNHDTPINQIIVYVIDNNLDEK